jgi:hypothetical protein
MTDAVASGTPAATGAPAAGEQAPGAGTPEGTPAPIVASSQPGSIDAVEPVVAETTEPVGVVQYDPTGDPGLDVALDFVGARGFGPDHPAIQAAEKGDFGPLKAALAALGDKAKGWEKHVALAELSNTNRVEKAKAEVAANQEAINKVVGGQENWNAIAVWARENSEPAEKTAINKALAAGGIAAKAMAAYLDQCHQKAAGTVKNPAEATKPGATPLPAANGGPLSAKEYATQVQALRQKLGYSFESSQEYVALQQRRVNAVRAGHV